MYYPILLYILGMKLLIHLQLSQFRISLIFYEFVVSLVLIFLNRVIVWLQSFFQWKRTRNEMKMIKMTFSCLIKFMAFFGSSGKSGTLKSLHCFKIRPFTFPNSLHNKLMDRKISLSGSKANASWTNCKIKVVSFLCVSFDFLPSLW